MEKALKSEMICRDGDAVDVRRLVGALEVFFLDGRGIG